MIDKELYHTFETPNAVMCTLAAPSLGTADLAVWTVEMRAGQAGPLHTADQEQVWVMLAGALAINGVEHPEAARPSSRRARTPDRGAGGGARARRQPRQRDRRHRRRCAPLPWAA